jgi:transcriptional regulator with XRE-family HTH domain
MPRSVKKELPPLAKEHHDIGARLATIRKKRRLTQTELADMIGISQYLVSNYETGRLHLSDEMLIRFAKALKASTDLILGLKDEDKAEPATSLRLQKRLSEIEKLPAADQRALLRNIDMFLRAARAETVPAREHGEVGTR